MKSSDHRTERKESGVALVTTVIVVAVLAVVAVAFMQSASTDRLSSRTVANYHQAQLVAEAGLADAMALLQRSISDFNYMSGSEPTGTGYRTYVRARSVEGGSWVNNSPPVYLDSGVEGDSAEIGVVGPEDDPAIEVRAAYKNLEDSDDPTAEKRYAFWVDEEGGKQSLDMWDQQSPPAEGYADNVAAIPLLLPGLSGGGFDEMPRDIVGVLRTESSSKPTVLATNLDNTLFNLNLLNVSNSLPSVNTANLLSGSAQGRINRYFFGRRNFSSATAPNGRLKLNLRALQNYLNNDPEMSNTEQGAGSPRAGLVEYLLQDNPPIAAKWGGGTLSWLTNLSTRYNAAEQKQILANIIDYLDDDIIPTTDSTISPSYFGVESKIDASGNTLGHPYIKFLTPGLLFNRNSNQNGPDFGKINSTRVLLYIGLIYPWNSVVNPAGLYTPEITIEMDGDPVVNGIPAVGDSPADYFGRTLSDNINVQPVDLFVPYSGMNFPASIISRTTRGYETPFFGWSAGDWPERAPAGITFPKLKFVFRSLRLRYDPIDGRKGGYVQILPPNLEVELLPEPLAPGGSGGAFVVKYTEAPFGITKNLYLRRDPRANFRTDSWQTFRSAANAGTNIPVPVSDRGIPVPFDITQGVDSARWDGLQGVPKAFNWYTALAVSNHLSRSPHGDDAIGSIGEVGYIWTGKPWQTINLTRAENEEPQTAEWNLLDYLDAGWLDAQNNIQSVKPLSFLSTGKGSTLANSLVHQGGFNVNTRKPVTASAVTQNLEALGVAKDAGERFGEMPTSARPSVYGTLAGMTELLVDPAADKKFAKEAVVRALGNSAVGQSRIFTVYSKGQFRKGGSMAEATLEADVFVGVNPDTGGPEIQVINKMFR